MLPLEPSHHKRTYWVEMRVVTNAQRNDTFRRALSEIARFERTSVEFFHATRGTRLAEHFWNNARDVIDEGAHDGGDVSRRGIDDVEHRILTAPVW